MDVGLTAGPLPPPLPPPLPVVLDYSRQLRPSPPAQRDGVGVMLAAAILCGAIALGLLAGLVDLLVVTWPSFGAILLAVPILLGVAAFAVVSVTSLRVASGVRPPIRPRPSGSMPPERPLRA